MDLHLHTPASSDYQEPQLDYLDILRQAEARNLDVIAFTDHNSVSGFAAMQNELHQLELLEQLERLKADEETYPNSGRGVQLLVQQVTYLRLIAPSTRQADWSLQPMLIQATAWPCGAWNSVAKRALLIHRI